MGCREVKICQKAKISATGPEPKKVFLCLKTGVTNFYGDNLRRYTPQQLGGLALTWQGWVPKILALVTFKSSDVIGQIVNLRQTECNQSFFSKVSS